MVTLRIDLCSFALGKPCAKLYEPIPLVTIFSLIRNPWRILHLHIKHNETYVKVTSFSEFNPWWKSLSITAAVITDLHSLLTSWPLGVASGLCSSRPPHLYVHSWVSMGCLRPLPLGSGSLVRSMNHPRRFCLLIFGGPTSGLPWGPLTCTLSFWWSSLGARGPLPSRWGYW